MKEWSREWKWTERTRAWDEHCDLEIIVANIDELVSMNRRHVQASLAVQAMVGEALDRMIESEVILKPADLIRFMEAAVSMERLARRADLLPAWEYELAQRQQAQSNQADEFDVRGDAAYQASEEFLCKMAALRREATEER